MSIQAFEALTRRAAAVSRRTSLASLGSVALVAAARPDVGEAKKKNKKKGKKKGGDELKKKCNNNEDECIATGTTLCEGDAQCLASIQLCCDECFSNDFLVCLIAAAA